MGEARKIELVMGATGKGSNSFQDIALANNLLGTRFKPVRGYKGGADITWRSSGARCMGAPRPGNPGRARIPAGCARRRSSTSSSLVRASSPRSAMRFPVSRPGARRRGAGHCRLRRVSLAMGRAVYAPPGTPTDRVAALRTALVATVQDPAYIADAKRLALDTATWQTGEAIQKVVNEAFSLSPALIQKAKAAMDLP